MQTRKGDFISRSHPLPVATPSPWSIGESRFDIYEVTGITIEAEADNGDGWVRSAEPTSLDP